MHAPSPSTRQLCSLARKLSELDIPLEPLSEVHSHLKSALEKRIDDLQKKALVRWRTHVREWHIQSKFIFRYLKNVSPVKATCINLPTGPTSSPYAVVHALQRY